jgi:hypothetical protein
MELKNYQEDLVLYVTELVLEDRRDIERSDRLLHDVAAYTLNRLPPRYIMSERGFTRLAADHWVEGRNGEGLVNLVEVLLLVNRAIDVVQHRRHSQAAAGAEKRGEEQLPDLTLYWHNLPYLIGRVVDRQTGRPVLGATVTLSINHKLAGQAEAGWPNPYLTNAGTRGFFSFLPRADRAKSRTRRFTLQLTVEHPGYEPFSLERVLQTRGEYGPIQGILDDRILNLETLALTPRHSG